MDAPVRKKKKKAVAEPAHHPTPREPDYAGPELPERGPYCPKCQYEFADTEKQQLQALLAAESKIVVDCPACTKGVIPVLDFKDTRPPPGKLRRAPLEPGVRAIIDTVFEVDFEKTWKHLHESLVVGTNRTDHGTVTAALDHAEDNARKAHQLFVNMKYEYEKYEIDHKVIWAGMYDEAHGMLQAEKKSGQRTKQITEADVKMKIAEHHPDEYRAHETEKKRFSLTVKHAENLSEQWSSKCRSLQVILSRMRGGGVA